ncbi:RNA methyltransferase [Actinoalloteichus sp. AHMU CJ021]|uniref:RNA methyltransferase, TrmH family n=1 Tax=Actinoalloteichus caeruleus DSM 43889 TaxID=1120930 RepID=A0ABT1JIK7_ACTCY|nr:TrmH family RNA methyltransferase [Actinoalloteichus caeruleus]AUS77686.1 RNA methyltransferase [Actinoalloteichus sp. AHMU CJ021]MCP2331601.1 RNA methyltransferase, TrmH family [Actinoalloteichus caeruleus DSM 43889]
MAKPLRITTRNARFQQWQALLTNRTKRQRAGEFVVQGVRPISLAVEHGWRVRSLLFDHERRLSRWASELLGSVDAERVAMAPDLLRELGEKAEETPELVAVVEQRPDDLDRLVTGPDFLGVVFDRPSTPGNIGALVRSADAFGASGLITTGHSADAYDPRSVRGSTGSLFSLPVVRSPSHREVARWVGSSRDTGLPLAVVGTDEHGTVDIDEYDLTGPTLLLVGNETTGLSAAWREACDVLVRIPITGAASSLNAANAGSVALYEAARQRARAPRAR